MDTWSDFLTIDGEIYNIKVKTGVDRNADFLDKYAERTDDGDLKRELIGVYISYNNIKFEKQTDANYSEYNRLYNKLIQEEEFHTIIIAGDTFTAYFSNVRDTMYAYKNGRPYYKNLQVNFKPKQQRGV